MTGDGSGRMTNQRARAERAALDRVVVSLAAEFPGVAMPVVERIVDRHYLEFYGAPVRAYVPVMVERGARSDLRARLGVRPQHWVPTVFAS